MLKKIPNKTMKIFKDYVFIKRFCKKHLKILRLNEMKWGLSVLVVNYDRLPNKGSKIGR